MKKLLLFFCISLFFFSCKKQSTTDPYALPDSYANQPLGKSANDILSAAKYTALNIEIQYMHGYPLDAGAIANVTNYLNSICNKPDGITINQTEIAGSSDTLDPAKIKLIEKQNRTAYTSGNTLTIYVLVSGGYDTSVSTLGISYRATSICLFGKNIFDHAGGPGQITRRALESGVLEHELGHLMGLVNVGSPIQSAHQDVSHGNHCTNTNCLMYYAMELHSGFGSNNTIPLLDSSCRQDLKANGGK